MQTLLVALAGDSVGVSNVATQLILGGRSGVLPDDLVTLTASPHAHVRVNALRTLAGSDRWEALIAGLERISDEDPRVAQAAESILANWRRIPMDLYTRPNASQSARIRSALMNDNPVLSEVRSTIEAILARP